MHTGQLLTELLELTELNKTDLAMSLYLSPSSLSNLLSGKRLPTLSDRRELTTQAASTFADALFDHQSHIKLSKLFPVIYEFTTHSELETFLYQAISFNIEKDWEQTYDAHQDYTEVQLGQRQIKNSVCILLSEVISRTDSDPPNLFSTLRLFGGSSQDYLDGIQIVRSGTQHRFKLNQFMSTEYLEVIKENTVGYNEDQGFLRTLHKLERYVDLRIWGIRLDLQEEFLIIGDEAVLSFSLKPEGTPMMTVITQKSYVYSCRQLIKVNHTMEQSFDRKRTRELLLDNPQLMHKLFTNSLSSVFTFTPLGYLLTDEELKQFEPEASIRQGILELYREINSGPCTTYMSTDVLRGHFSSSGTIVPMIGPVPIPKQSRIDYLKRFSSMKTKPPERSNVLDGSYPPMVIFCTKKLTLIYLPAPDGSEDKFHVIISDNMEQFIESECGAETNKFVDHSSNLWDTFVSNQEKNIQDDQ